MNDRLIINLGRQMGSGGRRMAQYLAQMLDLKFYDKELIHEASKDSGICKDCFEHADEKPQKLWYSRFPFWGEPGFNGLSNDALFEIHYHTVQRLAKENNCIFVGRCTDYILREDPACFNIFVHAPIEFRIERLLKLKKEEATTEKAPSLEAIRQQIEKTDKTRAAYYNFYTDKIWGQADSYHLCIDTSLFGIEESARKVAGWIREQPKRQA